HCDERGMQEYNLALGERRAVAVQSYLSTLGVRPTTTEAISYGEERPAVPGSSEEAWAKNRRVEFTITNQ
ncbi:MAG TPA: OmpA family protein, partial [Thermodesulfobacteriota bacterium]|nr:OmpA family protein [Thermodesulfobacteriota bacterium]